jgi:hypothetical protein
LSGVRIDVGVAPLPPSPPSPPSPPPATSLEDVVASESLDLLATSLRDEFIDLYFQEAVMDGDGVDGSEAVLIFAGLNNDIYMSLIGSAYNDEWEDETRLICR